MWKSYYNGYVLPTLPAEWDSIAYPVVYIIVDGSKASLYAFSDQGYIDTNFTPVSIAYILDPLIDVSYKCWKALIGPEAESASSNLSSVLWTEDNSSSYTHTFPATGFIWSNTSLTDELGNQYNIGSTPIDLDRMCGEAVAWDYDNEGTLLMYGSGATYDYNWEEENYPWQLIKDKIQRLDIRNGITKLGNANFHGLENLLCISEGDLPDSLIELGERCFGACHNATNFNLPDSLEIIGPWCFAECWGMPYFVLPKNLITIGEDAFQATADLHYFSLNNNSNFTVSQKILFDKNKTQIIHYPSQLEALTYTIPSTVTSIANSCFFGNDYLTSISIPSSVTEVGFAAFCAAPNLKEITLPSSISNIATRTFHRNNNLTTIRLLSATPPTVTEESIMLESCPKLEAIIVPTGTSETYKTDTQWEPYKHLIQEYLLTNFELKPWLMGVAYGLSGNPLPMPYEDLLVQIYDDVLHITKTNNIIFNDDSTIKIM